MDFIRLTQFTPDEIHEIFRIADSIENYRGFLTDKTVVMFFQGSSLRTRVSFEKGIRLLNGQTILFPPETLDKKEDIKDVCGYLQNWADAVIVRHRSIQKLDQMASYLSIPVINAMTDENHPCEILSDLYSLSKIRPDTLSCRYLYVGPDGNIGKAWREASKALGFSLTQCSPPQYRMQETEHEPDLTKAVIGKDIICTDSVPEKFREDFAAYQVTEEIMSRANKGAVLDPCPPFYRGEEVSEGVISSRYFVGYGFKKALLPIQQAVIIYCLSGS